MRWDRLFDDLEAQLARAADDDLAAEVADRTRREVARVRLDDRLRASVGAELELRVQGAGVVRGTLDRCGPGWLLVSTVGGSRLVAAAAIVAVSGVTVAAGSPAGGIASRLDLGYVLRGFARDRSTVCVVTRDAAEWVGTVDRVAGDHFDLALHSPDVPRRPAQVRSIQVVTFDGLAAVSSR